MTTTVIKSIKPGGGGDYLNLIDWAAARVGDITAIGRDTIEVAEVYGGGNACTTVLTLTTGWTTDPTHYIEVRAATGQAHTGVWDTNKAYFSTNGYMIISNQSLNVKRMQITSTGNDYTCFPLSPDAGQVQLFDGCFVVNAVTGSAYAVWRQFASAGTGLGTLTVQNCIALHRASPGAVVRLEVAGIMNVYNNTVRTTNIGLFQAAGTLNSQNNYIAVGVTCYSGTINKGANDATSNTEAVTANLRSIPYSTATFQVVTVGSENLRLVVSAANKLIDHGANLTSQGVTADVIGIARPQFGTFDIGAFENDVPICWNYTARYKNSNKTFKASGCGNYPKVLKIPKNVDISTSRMIDDGIEIDPNEYRIVGE